MRLTYEEWQRKGRQVQKGSKAVAWNLQGTALFDKAQTKPSSRNPYADENDAELYEDQELAFMDSDYMYDMGDR